MARHQRVSWRIFRSSRLITKATLRRGENMSPTRSTAAETRPHEKRIGWRMAEHAMVIAGGGPTGMMPAAELALADISDFPTRHPYGLGIWQNQIERIMAAWIATCLAPPLFSATMYQ